MVLLEQARKQFRLHQLRHRRARPAFEPGTGTREVGGLTTSQGLEIIRGCRGLDVVGCDLVEVSPPYEPSGNTALVGANLLFEMWCVLPDVSYRDV